MRHFLPIAAVIACMMLISTSFDCQEQSAVKDGDPLRLYLRRSPVQNLTWLNYYRAFNQSAEDKLEYTLTLGPRGSGTDKVVLFMPVSGQDNGLKYEPNSSVEGQYDFAVVGRSSLDPSGYGYDIAVSVEIDYHRGGSFKADRTVTFRISGPTDSELHRKAGEIDIDASDLRSMDGQDGGRLRVTIAREDYVNTSVLIYTGYRLENSFFSLPMSRYSGEDDGEEPSYLLMVVGGIVAGAVIVAIVYFMRRGSEKGAGPDDAFRSGRNKRQRR